VPAQARRLTLMRAFNSKNSFTHRLSLLVAV